MAIFQTVVRVGYVEYELVTILTLSHKKSVNGNRNFGKMFYCMGYFSGSFKWLYFGIRLLSKRSVLNTFLNSEQWNRLFELQVRTKRTEKDVACFVYFQRRKLHLWWDQKYFYSLTYKHYRRSSRFIQTYFARNQAVIMCFILNNQTNSQTLFPTLCAGGWDIYL